MLGWPPLIPNTARTVACKGYGGEAVHGDNPRVNPPRPSGDWEVLRVNSFPEV